MARKIETYIVTDEGRDKGKSFLLTEMAATKVEAWAIRAMLALGGTEIPQGSAQLAAMGLKGLFSLSYASAGPLLDELMECVQVVPDQKKPHVKRFLVESDVEEMKTRLTLKWEVLKLHFDFLPAGSLSELLDKAKVPAEEKRPNAPTSHK